MAESNIGPHTVGIDNVSPETGLPAGAVSDAVNCSFDSSGGVSRRPGYARGLATAGAHSLWTSSSGASYCVASGAVCRMRRSGSSIAVTSLFTLALNDEVSFDDTPVGIAFANRRQLGLIKTGDVAALMGVEDPGGVTVDAATVGGLPAGRYGCAVSFVASGEESGLSPAVFVTIAEGGGLRYNVPQPQEAAVTAIRLYRTGQNGDQLYRADVIPTGLTPYLLGVATLGRIADNQFQERMSGGQIVRYWRGRVLCANGSVLEFSQSLRYGRRDQRYDRALFPSTITLCEPVTGGVFVGTDEGVDFLAGEAPDAWTLRKTSGKPPIRRARAQIEAAEVGALGEALHRRGEVYALWLSLNGYVLGTSDGRIIELQGDRIRLPESQWARTGALAVHNRQVIAAIN